MWWVYILECDDGSYYVGVTDNYQRRHLEHQVGIGARHTKLRGAGNVVFREPFMSKALATKREQQLKKWSREKKRALIEGNIQKLRQLSISRD
ncbi:MAG: GIY-YIG nuclease family protein [Candidatus Omnitrophica bacterium]|nr:GIY-YIG nuclease family protein [Candidatus Omnitrophota bacterium]